MLPFYPPRFSEDDLLEIALNTKPFIEQFRNQNFLILGGTGFIGSWLAASLNYLNKAYKLDIKITCSARNLELVNKDSDSEIILISQPKLKSFLTEFPSDFIFHCATPTKSSDHKKPIESEKILNLTKEIIEIANDSKKTPRFMHLSSGAVYGMRRRKIDLPLTSNTEVAEFEDLDDYAQLKLGIENIVNIASAKGQVSGLNLRLFTFYGPGLSLVRPFAVTEFIQSAIQNKIIEISGDAESLRTFMYPTDLVLNILSIAAQSYTGNALVGGSEKVSIGKLATQVGKIWGAQTSYKLHSEPANYYYPDFGGDFQLVNLETGLNRWKNWLSHQI